MNRLIRLSSPKLNYIIIVGAILFYVSAISFVIPSTDPDAVVVFCNVSISIFLLSNRFSTIGHLGSAVICVLMHKNKIHVSSIQAIHQFKYITCCSHFFPF